MTTYMTTSLRTRLEKEFDSTMQWANMRGAQGMHDCARSNYTAAADIADRLMAQKRGAEYFTHWLTRRNVALQLAGEHDS